MRSTPACDSLRQDHRDVEVHLDRLMAALERVRPDQVAVIAESVSEIRRLLRIHFDAEDNVFYPAVRTHYPDLLASMDKQHDSIRELESAVAEMLAEVPDDPDPRWLEQLRSLAIEYHDLIQHHIVNEEDVLFRVAAACLSPQDQAAVAAAIRARRG